MHTNLKGVALFMATAIYPLDWHGKESIAWEDRCDILYNVVDNLLFTDEQKADLYARLAEQLDSHTPFNEAMRIIERAIHECQRPA